ncbi:hypothetical protein KC365_g3705 [Hortaea werneckii]|nr:hypothetical protein KC342_g6631 [Hortaea werneckii]KAI7099547.1 hypothetical protein KC339_g8117 [Hortaea werneckii]KAI7240750.1 hypothetical protein KC365_g3705 [Hortaea werneckii]KAI7407289.1 hypothetical protein KC328_g580 [Hortaea werneckii]
MAQQGAAQPKAPFPQPPPFYKHFTKANAAELKRQRKELASPQPHDEERFNSAHQPSDLNILSLPPELRYLIPPTPPDTTTPNNPPKAFSQALNLTPTPPTLADLSIDPLHPTHPSVLSNPQPHLLALSRSLLTTFLHLVGAQSQNAEAWEESTRHLERIVGSMHELINAYRPHQARESLILEMEGRVEGMRGEVERIRKGRRRVEELFQELSGEGGGDEGAVMGDREGTGKGMEKVDGVEGKRRERQRDAWDALGRLR